VYSAGLAAKLCPLSRVGDGFWSGVHVALTARRELHSGLVPGLEETEHRDIERGDQDQSPGTGNAARDHRAGRNCCDNEGDDPGKLTLTTFARSDVTYDTNPGGHGSPG